MQFNGTYFGTIEEVYPPTHPINFSKYQYEYRVLISAEGFAQIPINNCIRMDTDGSLDNYEDNILLPGSLVVITFFKGNLSAGLIIGATRQYKKPQPVIPSPKQQWLKRYNKFEISIDKDFNYMAKSDFGPYVAVKTNKIILDDSAGENLTLDKDKLTTTLNTKELITDVKNNSITTIGNDVTIEVKNNATIHIVGNVNMTVDGNVSLKCDKLNAKCSSLDATVSGTAKVQASQMQLIASGGIQATTPLLSVSGLVSCAGIATGGATPVPGSAIINGDIKTTKNVEANGDVKDSRSTMNEMRSAYNGHMHSDPQGGMVSPPTPPMK